MTNESLKNSEDGVENLKPSVETGEVNIDKEISDVNSLVATETANSSAKKVEVSEANPDENEKIDQATAEANAEKNKLKADTEKQINELKNQLEGENFGEAVINNPKIIDLIAEIEHCHITDKQEKEQQIEQWKRSVESVYEEAMQDYNENINDTYGMQGEVIYGLGGKDRFIVKSDGKVILQHDPAANLRAEAHAIKRAKELGMEVK